MAVHRGRATSRSAGDLTQIYRLCTSLYSLCWLSLFLLVCPIPCDAGLYTTSDQIILMTQDNVRSVLVNSTAAVVAEFYASWCGHCIRFSPLYKSLARDIKGRYIGPVAGQEYTLANNSSFLCCCEWTLTLYVFFTWCTSGSRLELLGASVSAGAQGFVPPLVCQLEHVMRLICSQSAQQCGLHFILQLFFLLRDAIQPWVWMHGRWGSVKDTLSPWQGGLTQSWGISVGRLILTRSL